MSFNAIKINSLFARSAVATMCLIVLGGVWFLAAFTIVGNFHLSIGGRL